MDTNKLLTKIRSSLISRNLFFVFSFISLLVSVSVIMGWTPDIQFLNQYETNTTHAVIIGIILSLLIVVLLRSARLAQLQANSAKSNLLKVRATLESTTEGIIVFGLDGDVIDCNKKFISMWHLQNINLTSLHQQAVLDKIYAQISDTESSQIKINSSLNNRSQEQTFDIRSIHNTTFSCSILPLYLNSQLIGSVWNFRDVSLQKRLETELSHQLTHDVLTNLPNKALLLNMIDFAINSAKHNNQIIGTFLLNLDQFTHFYELFGANKGDELIQLIVKNFKNCLSKKCTLGRISDREFLVIATLNDTHDAIPIITSLMTTANEPITFYEHRPKLNCSMGVAFYPKDGDTGDALLSNAAIALARVKKEGGNNYQFYTREMNSFTHDQILFENELRSSIENNELVVYYQPIINLSTLQAIGFEALIRWNHPRKGLISPAQFIPLAEEIGLIREIGDWVLLESCKQIKKWENEGFKDLMVAVNISTLQFKFGHLGKRIKEILQETGVEPSSLELELTESILLDKSNEVIDTLNEFRDLKIHLSIDDFGTGYSCLSHLKNFPIDLLKIDQTFVRGLTQNKADQALTKTIINLGKNLDMHLIAEGIETIDQLLFLQGLGCDFGQGYYFSTPLLPEQCRKFLV